MSYSVFFFYFLFHLSAASFVSMRVVRLGLVVESHPYQSYSPAPDLCCRHGAERVFSCSEIMRKHLRRQKTNCRKSPEGLEHAARPGGELSRRRDWRWRGGEGCEESNGDGCSDPTMGHLGHGIRFSSAINERMLCLRVLHNRSMFSKRRFALLLHAFVRCLHAPAAMQLLTLL